MNATWIVLANAARARIFESVDPERPAKEVATLVHPGSRLKAGDLASDRSGHTERHGTDHGQGGAAYDPRTDPRHKEHVQFAREVAQALHEGITSRRCDALLLVASNPFLGELKSSLSEAASRALRDCVASDLSALELPELRRRLAELLAAPQE